MHELPSELHAIAARQRNLTRAQLAAIGWSDRRTDQAVVDAWLQRLHPGIYLMGAGAPDWHQRVLGAVRAAGEGAEASLRSALDLRGLLPGSPSLVEVSAPHKGNPRPCGGVFHPTRRVEPVSVVQGIECSSVERALLETSALVPQVVIEKAFSAAWRRGLTTPEKCDRYLEHHGGRGRSGVTRFRSVIQLYLGTGRAPGSDGEVASLTHFGPPESRSRFGNSSSDCPMARRPSSTSHGRNDASSSGSWGSKCTPTVEPTPPTRFARTTSSPRPGGNCDASLRKR